MSETIHDVPDHEGRGDLNVTSFAGPSGVGPMLQFTITDYAGAKFVAADYAAVELLHDALGAWLLDRMLSGRVTRAKR